MRDAESVFNPLLEANTKFSVQKILQIGNRIPRFYGPANGNSTCADKVSTMTSFPQPTTLCGVCSFLGLAGYYGCFIKEFAKIARPLPNILRGEYGGISMPLSKKIKINLNDELIRAYDTLKNILMSEDIKLNVI